LGGAPNFTWEIIGGEGFSLGSSVTEGRDNTLFAANDTSCGSALIRVTDGCDNTVEASIQNVTRGQWTEQEDTCGMAGAVDSSWGREGLSYGDNWTLTGSVQIGGEKQYDQHKLYYGGTKVSDWFDTSGECDADRDANCGTVNEICLALPTTITWATGSYGGTYYHCGGSTRKYRKNCYESAPFGWRYGYGMLLANYITMNYSTWECAS
jgi:hypothetical protein